MARAGAARARDVYDVHDRLAGTADEPCVADHGAVRDDRGLLVRRAGQGLSRLAGPRQVSPAP